MHKSGLAAEVFCLASRRIDSGSLVYTDASKLKRGASLTAAWVQPSTGVQQALGLACPSAGKLVDLHAASWCITFSCISALSAAASEE